MSSSLHQRSLTDRCFSPSRLARHRVPRRRWLRRQGNAFTFSLVAAAAAIVLASAGWWMFGRGGGDETLDFLTTEVTQGPYDFVVIEQGTVESASNTELRCQVRSRGGGGGGGDRGSSGLGGSSTTILEVVPEGSIVKEGDMVVELDSSSLEIEENGQKILVSTRESQLAQALNSLKAAQIAKTEYLEGLYVSQEKLIQSEFFLAEQAFRTAEQGLKSAKSLVEKNIITGLQLESAYVAVENAKNQLDGAQTKLNTLRNLTKQKELTVLEASIASAEANVKTQQQGLELEQVKLKDIQDQIGKCKIRATAPGQVVYANETDMFRSSSSSQFVVTPGAMVRERQIIIRLPNANDMQVKATVNEARVTLIRTGLPVTIRVDALKDEVIEGEVTKVNQYAEAGSYSSGNIKKYATIIKIKNPPPELRVGMNAEVRIHVERMPSALQVPVQTLAEMKGHYFSLAKNGDQYETREVKIGSTNDKVATIESGLKEGDEVVMNPRSAGSLLKFPVLPDPTPVAAAAIKRTEPGESPVVLVSGKGGPGGEKGKKGGGNMTPATILARYLESDANKDDKLSKEELASMDERRRQALDSADKDGDGVLDKKELTLAAAQAMQKMRERMGGDGGGRGGGRRGGGGEGGPPGGAGPAGGGGQ
jgi:HlyD family secretion protein